MKKLKAVVSGIGRIGWQYHMPALKRHEGFDLVAAADPLAERRAEAEAEFGIRSYADATAMLDAEKPDLLVIASPSHVHADQAVAAMERGVDVFCDKPMAANLAEGIRMAEAQKRTGRKLMVFQPMRLERSTLAARQIISGRLIGDVYMIRSASSAFVRRNDWQAMKQYGGGTLNNAGSHAIDCMLHLAGSRASSVACHMRRVASLGDAEDVVKVLIRAENGVLLDIDINFASAIRGQARMAVYGSRGTAVLREEEDGYGWFEVKYFEPDSLKEKALAEGLAAPGRKYMREEIDWKSAEVRLENFVPEEYYNHCYDYFALGNPPFVPVEQTIEALRVIEECRNYDAR